MKLSDWAREEGIDAKTAYGSYQSGKFPRPTEQLPTGIILFHEITVATSNAVLYGRVSSADQKSDLEWQMQYRRNYAATCGLSVVRELQEIGLIG